MSISPQMAERQLDQVQSIDTLPLPVCTYTRGAVFADIRFPLIADFGHCAAKKMNYYGFKLGLRISRLAMIRHFPLLLACTHDVHHLSSLIEGFSGTVPADKCSIDEFQHQLWKDVQVTEVVTLNRKNMESSPQQVKLVKRTNYWRKLVETVN